MSDPIAFSFEARDFLLEDGTLIKGRAAIELCRQWDMTERVRRENARLRSRLARVLRAAESWRWSVSVYQGSEQRGGQVWSGRAARGAKR